MAVETYIGVNDVAQQVKKMYVGVGDVARKVTRMYIGVNGVAERVYKSSDLKIVTWNGGKDDEIAEMVKAADRGDINLTDYWSVGDTRNTNVELNDGSGTVWAYSCTFRLLDTSFKTLTSPTESGRTKCSFIVGLENLENWSHVMHTSNTSINWSDCSGRDWLNTIVYNGFPDSWKNGVIKMVVNQSSTQSNTNQTTNDKIFVPSEWEMFGKHKFSRTTRNDGWINWYQTTSHRYKSPNDNWEGYKNGACYSLRDKSSDAYRFCLRSCNQSSKEMWDAVPNQAFRISIHFAI